MTNMLPKKETYAAEQARKLVSLWGNLAGELARQSNLISTCAFSGALNKLESKVCCAGTPVMSITDPSIYFIPFKLDCYHQWTIKSEMNLQVWDPSFNLPVSEPSGSGVSPVPSLLQWNNFKEDVEISGQIQCYFATEAEKTSPLPRSPKSILCQLVTEPPPGWKNPRTQQESLIVPTYSLVLLGKKYEP